MVSTIIDTTKVIPLSYQTFHGNNIELNNKKIIWELTTKHNENKPLILWCQLFISLSPNTLQNILDTIRDIIIDDQIDIVDIPNMVLLIISNIQIESIQYDIVSPEHILSLTKIITHMIIDYELFSVSPVLQNNIVVEAMINACLELIQVDLKILKKIKTGSGSGSGSGTNDLNHTKKEETSDFWKWLSSFVCFWW